ncbi:hypothetical protein ACFSCX_05920 [Bacillus salitolerans]|uniref:Uncharacterized protein n=1 Tax=Bacillus salitolerans TaxID=1437434 RepID=A0ABW4LM33_9BACI
MFYDWQDIVYAKKANVTPTINITTIDTQILSEVNGKNSILLCGTVNHQNTGDVTLVKYSIDGLSGHTKKHFHRRAVNYV